MQPAFDKEKINNTPFFFIIGRSRSGTTLLMTMYDAHPNVIIPFESPYNWIYWNRFSINRMPDFIKNFLKARVPKLGIAYYLVFPKVQQVDG
jgi:hypothetical protein